MGLASFFDFTKYFVCLKKKAFCEAPELRTSTCEENPSADLTRRVRWKQGPPEVRVRNKKKKHVELQKDEEHVGDPGGCVSDSVGLPVDRASFSSRRRRAGEAPLCGFRAGAVLAVVIGRRGGTGGSGRGGRRLGLLLKVRYDDRQVSNRHLQVLGAAPVDVF